MSQTQPTRRPRTPAAWVCTLCCVASWPIVSAGESPAPSAKTPSAVSEIRYGGDANFPPYEYLDAKGEPAGLNVDLIRAIGRLQGLPVSVRLAPWPQIRAGMQDGTINVAAMYRSPQRAQEVDFAIPHELIYHEMFVRRGNPSVQSISNLAGKRVLVQSGTYAADHLSERDHPPILVTVASEPEALERLAQGTGDVAVVTQTAGRPFQERLQFSQYISPVGPPVLLTEYAFVTGKGQATLIDLLNQGVAELKSNGEYDRLYDRWLRPDRSARLAQRIAWALGATLLVALSVVVWNQSLRRQVARQTKALRLEFEEKSRAQAAVTRFERHLRQSQKVEAVGQLAGGVAHDFNNILTAILMQLNLLNEDHDLPPEARTAIKELEAEANRAANLTRQLLLFSRRQVMDVRTVDFNSLLGNLLRMLRRLIGEKVSLEFAGASSDLWVEADPGMLEQVIVNLVVNARDAMPGGGRITLTTRLAEVDVNAARDCPDAYAGRFVCLVVSDTGSGIDPATLKRIFEPFFTTKEAGKGTGLGLATVFGILKQHQGWIEVQSAVGRGSTFTVFLPAKSPALPSPNAPPSAPLAPGNRETLLLVEDEPAVRATLAAMLRRLHYQVREAGHPGEALQVWEELQGRVDLLLTDMVMPGELTGLDLIEQLRQRKPGLKVILMSGYSPDIADNGLPQEAVLRFLQKPFEAAALTRTIQECLRSPTPLPPGPG